MVSVSVTVWTMTGTAFRDCERDSHPQHAMEDTLGYAFFWQKSECKVHMSAKHVSYGFFFERQILCRLRDAST